MLYTSYPARPVLDLRILVLPITFSVIFCAGCTSVSDSKQLTGPDNGISVRGASNLRYIVPAKELEIDAAKEFERIKKYAQEKNELAAENDSSLISLKLIADELRPFANQWNPAAAAWNWEVILIKNEEVNAFCYPGGKIVFFSGIIKKLKLNSDEVAIIMGHEMAHALREHSRARIARAQLSNLGADILSQTLGLRRSERRILGFGKQIIGLKFSRADETDADLVGLDIAARAGFNPESSITLWQKMRKYNKVSQPEWLSTHPTDSDRIEDIRKSLFAVMPIYKKALEKKMEL